MYTCHSFLRTCFRSRNRKMRGIVQDCASPAVGAAAHKQLLKLDKASQKAAVKTASVAAAAAVDRLQLGQKRPNKLSVSEYCALFESLRTQGITLR